MGWLSNYKHKKLIKKAIRKAKEESEKDKLKRKIFTCQYPKCKNKVMGTSRFRCPYCNKVFCEKHRLPEHHKCKNPKLPDSMKRGFGTKMAPISE